MRGADVSSTSGVAFEGGVASDVAIMQQADRREIVIKQALTRLKVVADWRCDPARSGVEVEALRVARELLGHEAVPQVLWADAANHRFAMERIGGKLENWQVKLAAGHVKLDTAARAGELLAQLHVRSAQRPDLASRFDRREFFEQLRIEPFFMRSAERNPQARQSIQRVVDVLRLPGRTLVHGDYSPKNILAHDAQIVVLDWEVAYWGDPRFDVAFCLSHLLLNGLRSCSSRRMHRDACLAFSEAYTRHALVSLDDTILVSLLGCLVLARLDGDSPVNYRDELNMEEVREAALEPIMRPSQSLSAVFGWLS